MKIIHCADLHLDSKMQSNLDNEKAKERRNELLITFQNMVKYAVTNDVSVIIIAGDMFDKKNISVKARNIVRETILSNENIDFIYLKGNHDEAIFIEDNKSIKNLKMFDSLSWKQYSYGNITISGIEFNNQSDYSIYSSLMIEKNKINIVVMHGQDVESNVKDKTQIINLKALKNKNIDYLALGHIHTYKKEKLDNRGIYCYSGCLEGRGFDECGEKGFVLLDISNKIETTFVPFSSRNLYEIKVDLTGITENNKIEEEIEKCLLHISSKSLVKIVLTGEKELEDEIDVDYFVKKFESRFYYLKIYDKQKIRIDPMKYKNDISLKGEFIRLVLKQNDLTDEEKNKVITTGIRALRGEEI